MGEMALKTWAFLLIALLNTWSPSCVIGDELNAKRSKLKRVSRGFDSDSYRKEFTPSSPFESDSSILGGAEKPRARMLSPGYYSQECNAHKPCENARYCHMFLCVHCLKENVACTQNGQCCSGQCTYGRCKKDAQGGSPGTFCDRHDDCKDPAGTCCVREPAINPHISVCKPPLEENMVCGPINFFKNVYVGAQVQKSCGPCKDGLMCKQVGIFGVHEICVKDDEKK